MVNANNPQILCADAPSRRPNEKRRLRNFILALVFAALFPAIASGTQTHLSQVLADGFDFPVGKPDAKGYYKARGFWPNGHLGEDWNGVKGGNTDLGDPVYNIGDGVVVQAQDIRKGWGNVVIIRHAFRNHSGQIQFVDSLYGHLDKMFVRKYQKVKRGQLIGTIGTNRGMYLAHLHLEIHKNLKLGMNRSKFKRDYSNYYSPTNFINTYRHLPRTKKLYRVPVDTFGETESTTSSKAVVKSDLRIAPPPKRKTIILPATPGKKANDDIPYAKPVGRSKADSDPRIEAFIREQEKRRRLKQKPDKSFWNRLKERLGGGRVKGD